jgi:predicted GNAT superfamily acetyltransferase
MKNKYTLQNTGSIVKSKSNDPFTRIPNITARTTNLSLKAKGLLLVLISLPDDWAVYKSNLHQFSEDGRDATTNAFNELIDKGYIESFQRRNDKGNFIGWDYVIYDISINNPITENTLSDHLTSVNPS